MQFDFSRFLVAMFQAFLDCQDDGAAEQPRDMLIGQHIAVRFAARRELRRQAKKQGANRRDRKRFIDAHIADAMASLEREIDIRCKN